MIGLSRVRLLLILFVLSGIFCLPAHAQSGATLRGLVTSSTDGRPLPKANVVLRTMQDSLFRATVTNTDGYHEFDGVPPAGISSG